MEMTRRGVTRPSEVSAPPDASGEVASFTPKPEMIWGLGTWQGITMPGSVKYLQCQG